MKKIKCQCGMIIFKSNEYKHINGKLHKSLLKKYIPEEVCSVCMKLRDIEYVKDEICFFCRSKIQKNT